MEWRPFVPTSGGPKWPVVLVVPAGQFKGGTPFDNGVVNVAEDLAAAGYYTLAVTHRLAPCGLIKGQACHEDALSGRPEQQINDVKSLVKAARADSHCKDGMVGIVGGSSGGTHAIEVALDKAATPGGVWPDWGQGDRANCAVSLSGAYDFSDRTPEGYLPDPLPSFVNIIENYTDSCIPSDQKAISPVKLVTYSNIRPIFVINSEEDPMPWHQIADMQCALENQGVSSSLYQVLTIPGDEHAFGYWDFSDGGYPQVHPVSFLVISFLDAHLK